MFVLLVQVIKTRVFSCLLQIGGGREDIIFLENISNLNQEADEGTNEGCMSGIDMVLNPCLVERGFW
jgi:hypothetical protein